MTHGLSIHCAPVYGSCIVLVWLQLSVLLTLSYNNHCKFVFVSCNNTVTFSVLSDVLCWSSVDIEEPLSSYMHSNATVVCKKTIE